MEVKSIRGVRRFALVPVALLLAVMLTASTVQRTSAAAQTITANQAQGPVKLDGVVEPNEWTDAQVVNITTAGMGVAFKHNATGLFMLFQWKQSGNLCKDKFCYAGVEMDFANNTGVMGGFGTPAVMLLLSPSFTGGADEFISKAETTPATVESAGYKTQATCATALNGTVYTGECYRPFKLANASPYDPFPSLVAGSSIEIGFAVGEFNLPGLHSATDMSSYVLTLSSQTYGTGPPVTTTTTTTTPSSTTTSTRSTTTLTLPPVTLTSTVTAAPPKPTPSVTDYATEFVVIVVGFGAFIAAVMWRYRKS